jgi:hypothetical protein
MERLKGTLKKQYSVKGDRLASPGYALGLQAAVLTTQSSLGKVNELPSQRNGN